MLFMMSTPVGRWLQTFMCQKYADIFESWGYKTLQSVCRLEVEHLRSMGVLPEDCDTIMENVTILHQSLAAQSPAQPVVFPDPLTSPASSALMSMSRNAHRGYGGNNVPAPRLPSSAEPYPQSPSMPYPGIPSSPPYEYNRFPIPENYNYGSPPWSHPSYNQMRYMKPPQPVGHGGPEMWPRVPGATEMQGADVPAATFGPRMSQSGISYRNYAVSQDPQQVANDIVNMATQRYSHPRPPSFSNHVSQPAHPGMRRYRLGNPSASTHSTQSTTAGGPSFARDRSPGFQTSHQFGSGESSCTSPVSPNVSMTSPGSVYSNNSSMYNHSCGPADGPYSAAASPMSAGMMSPSICRMQSIASSSHHSVQQEFTPHIPSISEENDIHSPPSTDCTAASVEHSITVTQGFPLCSQSPLQSDSLIRSSSKKTQLPGVNSTPSFPNNQTHLNKSTSVNIPSSHSVSQQTVGRPTDPLQSLHKLAMFTNSQVIDPKSVVHDACFSSSGMLEGDGIGKFEDGVVNVEPKNCTSGSSVVNMAGLSLMGSNQLHVQQPAHNKAGQQCHFTTTKEDIIGSINFETDFSDISNQPDLKPSEFDLDNKIPSLELETVGSDNDPFLSDKLEFLSSNDIKPEPGLVDSAEKDVTEPHSQEKELDIIKQNVPELQDKKQPKDIENENPLISELLGEESLHEKSKIKSPDGSPLKRESNMLKKGKSKKKKLQENLDEVFVSQERFTEEKPTLITGDPFVDIKPSSIKANLFNHESSSASVSKGKSSGETDPSVLVPCVADITDKCPTINNNLAHFKNDTGKTLKTSYENTSVITETVESMESKDQGENDSVATKKLPNSVSEAEKQTHKLALEIRRRRRVRNFVTPKASICKTDKKESGHQKGGVNTNSSTEHMSKNFSYTMSSNHFQDTKSMLTSSDIKTDKGTNMNCLKFRDSSDLLAESVNSGASVAGLLSSNYKLFEGLASIESLPLKCTQNEVNDSKGINGQVRNDAEIDNMEYSIEEFNMNEAYVSEANRNCLFKRANTEFLANEYDYAKNVQKEDIEECCKHHICSDMPVIASNITVVDSDDTMSTMAVSVGLPDLNGNTITTNLCACTKLKCKTSYIPSSPPCCEMTDVTKYIAWNKNMQRHKKKSQKMSKEIMLIKKLSSEIKSMGNFDCITDFESDFLAGDNCTSTRVPDYPLVNRYSSDLCKLSKKPSRISILTSRHQQYDFDEADDVHLLKEPPAKRKLKIRCILKAFTNKEGSDSDSEIEENSVLPSLSRKRYPVIFSRINKRFLQKHLENMSLIEFNNINDEMSLWFKKSDSNNIFFPNIWPDFGKKYTERYSKVFDIQDLFLDINEKIYQKNIIAMPVVEANSSSLVKENSGSEPCDMSGSNVVQNSVKENTDVNQSSVHECAEEIVSENEQSSMNRSSPVKNGRVHTAGIENTPATCNLTDDVPSDTNKDRKLSVQDISGKEESLDGKSSLTPVCVENDDELGFTIMVNDSNSFVSSEDASHQSGKSFVQSDTNIKILDITMQDIKKQAKQVEIPLEIVSIIKSDEIGSQSINNLSANIKVEIEDVMIKEEDPGVGASKGSVSKAKKKPKKRKRKSDVWEEGSDDEESFKMLNLGRTFDLFKSGKIKKPKLDIPKGKGNKGKQTKGKTSKTEKEIPKFVGPVIKVKGAKEKPVSFNIVNISDPDQDIKVRSGKDTERNIIGAQSSYDLNDCVPFVCAICGHPSSHEGLGDLYGPYYPKDTQQVSSKKTQKGNKIKTPQNKSGTSVKVVISPESSSKNLPQRNKKKSMDSAEWVCATTKKGTKSPAKKAGGSETVTKKTKGTPNSKPGKKKGKATDSEVIDLTGPEDNNSGKTDGKEKQKKKESTSIKNTPKKGTDTKKSQQRTPKEKKETKSSKSEKSCESVTEIWVHEDCLIWTTGVYVVGYQICGIEEAVIVSRASQCSVCKKIGATLGCFNKGCGQKYHYVCSVDAKCFLDEENFSVFCPKHKGKRLKALGEKS